MAVAANAAVRERRRKSTPLDLERLNVLKALTAAEYSRRQFILNYAASRDTQLLIPGKKSDAVKAAEEWAARRLSQDGHQAPDNEFLKYTVDARLWSTHVGDDVEFPFAFMRRKSDEAPSDTSRKGGLKARANTEPCLYSQETDLGDGEVIAVTSAGHDESRSRSLKQQQRSDASTPQTRRQRSTKHRQPVQVPVSSDKKRSLSLTSIDDLKAPQLTPEKSPFLVRLSRSWSRRLSTMV